MIANATHDQLRQTGNLAYSQLFDAFTKAQAERNSFEYKHLKPNMCTTI